MTTLRLVDVALDDYEDVFSDFDVAPYSSRELSDDFIKELMERARTLDKERPQIWISIPKEVRDPKKETIVKKRIRQYFKERLREADSRIHRRKMMGLTLFLSGVSVLTLLLWLQANVFDPNNILHTFAETLMEPAGWFGMWEGLNKLIEKSKEDEQRESYEKILKADIKFIAEEDLIRTFIKRKR